MKTRTIKRTLPDINLVRSDHWTSYDVKVVTPIFGGGTEKGEPDKTLPIRARSIRGQLRYWWRFLNQSKFQSRTTLFREEARIWGDVNDNERDNCGQVRVRTRIERAPNIEQYLESYDYALFVAQKDGSDPPKDIIKAPFNFKLLIRLDDASVDLERDIVPALRWWSTFGGVGGRTRRGVGSVVMPTLSPITQQEAHDHSCLLVMRPQDRSDNAIDAWKKAVSRLKTFRQGANFARNRGKNTNTPGRSKWPEPDSIRQAIQIKEQRPNMFKDHAPEHEAMGTFPRAAFGLPIVTRFMVKGNDDPSEITTTSPAGAERLASPIILTAYPVENDHFVPAALRLPIDHINSLALELKLGNQKINDTFYPTLTSAQAAHILPIKNHLPEDVAGERSTYALEAFMHFFDSNTV